MTKESKEKTHQDPRDLRGLVKILLWVTAVLFVVTIISVIRSFQLSDSVSQLDTQSKETKKAAIEARDALQKAIDESKQQAATTPDAVKAAFDSIARIEQHLCGGPCDVSEL